MSFKFEWIRPGDPIEDTEEYKKAVALHYGLRFGSRLFDLERNMTLYCVAVNENEERPPGKYLLFFQSHIIIIHAYDQLKKQMDGSLATNFRIDSLEIPAPLQSQKSLVCQMIIEALEAKGFADVLPITSVTVEFPNNFWERGYFNNTRSQIHLDGDGNR